MLDWLWKDWLWFPENLKVTWRDLENRPGSPGYIPQLRELNLSLILAVAFLLVRYVAERIVIIPLGYRLGVTRRKKHALVPNVALETAYCQKKPLKADDILRLTKETDMTERQIQIWLRKRKQNDTTQPINKFAECGWHCLFYGTAFFGGLYVLWDKPWFADTKNNWREWPYHYMPDSVYWYYMLECAFYWSLVFTLCYDNQRKDFKEMIFHHVATLFLIYFSWMMNFVRVGTLVLLVHDAADPLLALAKMCHYTKLPENFSTGFFVCFLLVWIVSRLYFYPFKILYSTTIEPYIVIEKTFFAHWFFNVLLYFLMVLHLLWTYSIARIAIKRLTAGKMEDVRSDSDESEIDDTEEPYQNGNMASNYSNNNVKL